MIEVQAIGPIISLLPFTGAPKTRLIHKKVSSVDLSGGKSGLFLFPGEAEILHRAEKTIIFDSAPGELVVVGVTVGPARSKPKFYLFKIEDNEGEISRGLYTLEFSGMKLIAESGGQVLEHNKHDTALNWYVDSDIFSILCAAVADESTRVIR